RGLVVLEVALEDTRALDQHLAPIADLHVDTRGRAPGGRRIGLGIGLQRDQAGELGGAIHLLEIHADRAEEAERVGSQRRAAGVGPAGAQQAELVPHRAVDEELTERGLEAKTERDGLALAPENLRAFGGGARALEHPAL